MFRGERASCCGDFRTREAFVERRFPCASHPRDPPARVYAQAKGLRWKPRDGIAWGRFDPAVYAHPVREAARLVWSRRAWGTYPGLGENTALLIRFCLESGAAGMDAKLFLSFRPAEESKHLEACFLFAKLLGGYESDPGEAVARASNHPSSDGPRSGTCREAVVGPRLGCPGRQLDMNLCEPSADSSREPRTARQGAGRSRGTSSATCSSRGLLDERMQGSMRKNRAAVRRPSAIGWSAWPRRLSQTGSARGSTRSALRRGRLLPTTVSAPPTRTGKGVVRATLAQVRDRLAHGTSGAHGDSSERGEHEMPSARPTQKAKSMSTYIARPAIRSSRPRMPDVWELWQRARPRVGIPR